MSMRRSPLMSLDWRYAGCNSGVDTCLLHYHLLVRRDHLNVAARLPHETYLVLQSLLLQANKQLEDPASPRRTVGVLPVYNVFPPASCPREASGSAAATQKAFGEPLQRYRLSVARNCLRDSEAAPRRKRVRQVGTFFARRWA